MALAISTIYTSLMHSRAMTLIDASIDPEQVVKDFKEEYGYDIEFTKNEDNSTTFRYTEGSGPKNRKRAKGGGGK